ncbi:BQ5605_C013g07363 [Microbotryum silenes-dioicae]|uniref:BQ5605_C013g07363 protein n=1 Tax=Microbotryum silenes-dioicae TaxID=796604 RepID=A0A2X0NP31_9BASI|nr:BQ5605_C013g07363 [Microbotryum silenes-dioicae]
MFANISPKTRVWAFSAIVSLSSSLFGGDTGSIGAITAMPQFIEHFGELSEFLRGFVVAVILIPSAITGMFAGSVADRIGRRRTVSVGTLIFAAGMAMCVAAPNLIVFIVGRCVAGSGEGLFLSAGTVYLGRIMTMYQMFLTAALALGFFVCYGTIRVQSSLAWRLPIIISASVAFLTGIASLLILPYSPRWLVSQGRKAEAEAVLSLITSGDEEERKELLQLPPRGDKAGWIDIFRKGVRGRTLLGAFLNIFQQLSGIDFVLFYAPLLFAQAGLDPKTSAFVASGVTGVVLFVMSAISATYVDRAGRRTLFLRGGLGIAVCHTLIGALYASGAAYSPGGKWAIIVLIELFAILFSGTWAIVVRIYSTEIQPSRTRSAASSFCIGVNQLVNTLVALTSPAFLAKSPYGPYFLYGGLSAFATAVAYLYIIDTSFHESPTAVNWPPSLLLNSARRTQAEATRRPSRGSNSRPNENGRPSFSNRYKMERLGSDMGPEGLQGSAIEE